MYINLALKLKCFPNMCINYNTLTRSARYTIIISIYFIFNRNYIIYDDNEGARVSFCKDVYIVLVQMSFPPFIYHNIMSRRGQLYAKSSKFVCSQSFTHQDAMIYSKFPSYILYIHAPAHNVYIIYTRMYSDIHSIWRMRTMSE